MVKSASIDAPPAIRFACACGTPLKVPASAAGRKARCPSCGVLSIVPGVEPRPAPAAAAPAIRPKPQPPAPSRPPRFLGRIHEPSARARTRLSIYWGLLVIALAPLAWSAFHPVGEQELLSRLRAAVEASPEALEKIAEKGENVALDEILSVLPGNRLEGALLARDSWAHWVFALLSCTAFAAATVFLSRRGRQDLRKLLGIGFFTATVGIFLLLACQWLAALADGVWLHGHGILILVFYIAKLIGFSYRAALDPENGLILSCLGFTCGVGLCEEIIKALPVLVHYGKKADTDWRQACLWGLFSGIGFGVSEGITYSSDFYNGLSGGDVYIVRFVSCVALHAAWSGAAAITACLRQELIQGAQNGWARVLGCVRIVLVPMTLHGLYDTLLKKEHPIIAIAIAAMSLAWLARQAEVARRTYGEETAAGAAPASA